MLTRRTFLGSATAAAALFGGAALSRAHAGTGGKRFLFLAAEGGWDPLTVFAPLFGFPGIEMEPDAEPWTVGGLTLVDHPARPNTRAFFEQHHGGVAVLDGVSVRSVNHETCAAVSLTGSPSEDGADFATILGYEQRAAVSLPHLVMSGPSFPGPYSVFVSNAQGLLQPTIDGSLLSISDSPVAPPERVASRMVDRFLVDRAEALQLGLPGPGHAADYGEALRRARLLVDSGDGLQLSASTTFLGRAQTAIESLAAGLCRCASVGTGALWDTHQNNGQQSQLFEAFFADLTQILATLEATMGPEGRPLREDTVVVVSSEMGRTPSFNSTAGRDHWPYTSMMLMGPGIRGDRKFGGYTALYGGVGVDPGGNPDASRPGIPAESVGATLLVLGDVDPVEYLGGATPIPGVLT